VIQHYVRFQKDTWKTILTRPGVNGRILKEILSSLSFDTNKVEKLKSDTKTKKTLLSLQGDLTNLPFFTPLA
jgi:hypothetical protein